MPFMIYVDTHGCISVIKVGILSYLVILLTYSHLFALQIVLALLNARMSSKSFKIFSGPVLLPLISLMLSKFSLIVPLVCIPMFLITVICILLLLILLYDTEHYASDPLPTTSSLSLYHKIFRWPKIWYALQLWVEIHLVFLNVDF